MSYRRAITAFVLSIALLIIGGIVNAQELLPVPAAGNVTTAAASASSIDVPAIRNTRADGSFIVSYYWYASNPSFPWNGNGIIYDFTNFGPGVSGIAYIDYATSRGSCSIQNAGQNVLCNFGSSIPGNVVVSISLLIQYADTIDWFIVGSLAGANYWYDNYVMDPFNYSTNIVLDPGFEEKGLPQWNLVSGAKRACNKTTIVSYDEYCALLLKAGSRATINLTLPHTFNNGDVIWIGWYGASKNVQKFTKLVVISKSLSGQKAKTVWRVAEGTSEYAAKFLNHHIPKNSNKVKLKIVGGTKGKAWFDLLNVLPVNFDGDDLR